MAGGRCMGTRVLLCFELVFLSLNPVFGQTTAKSSTNKPSPSVYPCILQSVVIINASSGYIISPNFPSWYGNRQICTWRIQLSDKMQVVKLSTSDNFGLEASSSGCYDYLSIKALTSASIISTQCGDIFTELVVKDSIIEVKFTSDESDVFRGFKILFESIAPPPIDMTSSSCGLRASQPSNSVQKIVGGVEATPNSFPWQVALTYRDGSQFCGGTIVHPQWVVTAAHCMVDEIAFDTIVKVGAHNLKTPGGSNAVQSIIVHPRYNTITQANDIALLRLAYPLVFTKKVTPACVAPNNAASYAGRNATITGWGTLRSGGVSPNVLMQAQVTVMNDAECRRRYLNEITSSMICAGGSGKDTCQGDSGGPLVVQKPNGAIELIGITSWGKGCGAIGTPGVYTSVSYMGPWIRGYISGI